MCFTKKHSTFFDLAACGFLLNVFQKCRIMLTLNVTKYSDPVWGEGDDVLCVDHELFGLFSNVFAAFLSLYIVLYVVET